MCISQKCLRCRFFCFFCWPDNYLAVTFAHEYTHQTGAIIIIETWKARQENEKAYFVGLIVFSVHIGMNEFLLRKLVISKNFYINIYVHFFCCHSNSYHRVVTDEKKTSWKKNRTWLLFAYEHLSENMVRRICSAAQNEKRIHKEKWAPSAWDSRRARGKKDRESTVWSLSTRIRAHTGFRDMHIHRVRTVHDRRAVFVRLCMTKNHLIILAFTCLAHIRFHIHTQRPSVRFYVIIFLLLLNSSDNNNIRASTLELFGRYLF